MNVMYDDFVYKTIASENEKELNCTVPFHPDIASKLTGRIIEICNDSERGLKAVQNYKYLVRSTAVTNNNPCSTIKTHIGFPEIDPIHSSQEAYIKLYIMSIVPVKSVVIHYDLSTFIAAIGGYVGMLSLIHI